MLVSGDINFAAELSDLRHRHNLHVICLHNAQAQDALLECAHEARRFDHFTADLPVVFPPKVNKFFFSLLMPVFHFEYFENFEFNNYLEAEMNYTTVLIHVGDTVPFWLVQWTPSQDVARSMCCVIGQHS